MILKVGDLPVFGSKGRSHLKTKKSTSLLLVAGTVHEPMTDLFNLMSKLVDSKGKILIPGINVSMGIGIGDGKECPTAELKNWLTSLTSISLSLYLLFFTSVGLCGSCYRVRIGHLQKDQLHTKGHPWCHGE